MIKQTFAAIAMGATALTSTAAFAQDWREDVPVFRIGLLGGENEADRLREHACQEAYLEERLGVDVELFPASDYAGVMQGLLAGQLEFAGLGSAGLCGHLPAGPRRGRAALYHDADRRIARLLLGHVHAGRQRHHLARRNGRPQPRLRRPQLHLRLPRALLRAGGRGRPDLETYFSETGFGGGHEQAVVAVLNGQYDAGVTWTSGVGDINMGYSRGNLRSMVDKDMLDMSEIQIIWQSNLITNGPRVIRSDLPQELKDLVMGAMMQLQVADRDCFDAINDGESMGYWPINHEFYEPIINMRRELAGSR
jgi:phosphonate transport system substrate-binding protein